MPVDAIEEKTLEAFFGDSGFGGKADQGAAGMADIVGRLHAGGLDGGTAGGDDVLDGTSDQAALYLVGLPLGGDIGIEGQHFARRWDRPMVHRRSPPGPARPARRASSMSWAL